MSEIDDIEKNDDNSWDDDYQSSMSIEGDQRLKNKGMLKRDDDEEDGNSSQETGAMSGGKSVHDANDGCSNHNPPAKEREGESEEDIVLEKLVLRSSASLPPPVPHGLVRQVNLSVGPGAFAIHRGGVVNDGCQDDENDSSHFPPPPNPISEPNVYIYTVQAELVQPNGTADVEQRRNVETETANSYNHIITVKAKPMDLEGSSLDRESTLPPNDLICGIRKRYLMFYVVLLFCCLAITIVVTKVLDHRQEERNERKEHEEFEHYLANHPPPNQTSPFDPELDSSDFDADD